jgi:hypothetical protein
VTTRRWEGDDQGEGVGDAAAFARGATELTDAMRRPTWVAEEPELHLLPHVERACASLPLELVDAVTDGDGTLELRLGWARTDVSLGEVRASVFALIGSFAEPATYVRQRVDGETLSFDVVTGFVGSDTVFAPHGHTVRISVSNAHAGS